MLLAAFNPWPRIQRATAYTCTRARISIHTCFANAPYACAHAYVYANMNVCMYAYLHLI